MSLKVAEAVSARWSEMGRDAVHIMIDADPETCRMGYGCIEALQLLRAAAEKIGGAIHHRPGIRIGLLIADDTIVAFSPTPLLIEGGLKQFAPTNALLFKAGPSISIGNAPFWTDVQHLVQEGELISDTRFEQVANDLRANPPLKFDLAQKVRVFNSQLEFVEFELKGLAISRKTVPIPSDLMGLADARAQKLLRSTFKLVGQDSQISGERVLKIKQWIIDRFLIVLPGFGTVILRSNKEEFEAAVTALKKYVVRFQRHVQKNLNEEMDANRDSLLKALTPAVCDNPPARWKKQLGSKPNKEQVQALLDFELKQAFGSVSDVFAEMKVNVIFKGVTYESLSDPKFMEAARKAIPHLKVLHEEYDAAKAVKHEPFVHSETG
jgi:hypothetical protein